MKIALFSIFLTISTFCLAGLGPVPVVPANIEIAGVKLKLTADAREEIQKDVNALRASDKYFSLKLDRVNLYFPLMEKILKEEGVPDELKYLAVQESSLISDAVSVSDAVGYWQFKDFTAREVGLRVDNKIDERKNIASATRGAAKYFKRNNFYFKNWIYSVSAYQAGPGGAKKYIDEKNIGSDKLTITSKSHWYVLRFIAHVIAFQDEVGLPHSEGLQLVEYKKGEGKTLSDIAKELKMEEDDLEDYNKWLRHGKIPDDKIYSVIVPVKGNLPKDLKDEKSLTRSIPRAEPIKYPSKITNIIGRENRTIFIKINGIEALMAGSQDNLVDLALKAEISSDRLMKFNDLRNGQKIEAGEIYYIKHKKNRSPIRYHVAQYNESLWDISQKYGIKLKHLLKKNRMEEGEALMPGRLLWLYKTRPSKTPIEFHSVQKPIQKIKPQPIVEPKKIISTPKVELEEKPPVKNQEVPKEKKTDNTPTTNRKIHVVQPGETLWAISKKYQVTVDDMVNWNGLATGTLSVGQELILMPAAAEANEATKPNETALADTLSVIEKALQKISNPKPDEKADTPIVKKEEEKDVTQYHIVQQGESLWSISRKYNVSVVELSAWNHLESGMLSVGEKLIVVDPSILSKEKQENETQVNETAAQEEILESSSDKIPEYHEVQPGESLWSIAKKYLISVEELLSLNGLTKESALRVGQKIRLLLDTKSQEASITYETYLVKGGDSLYKIALDYNMSVEELMEINKLETTSLSVGQELKVRKK